MRCGLGKRRAIAHGHLHSEEPRLITHDRDLSTDVCGVRFVRLIGRDGWKH